MTEITDMDLMTYADGEGTPERRREIALAIAADPALKVRLLAYEKTGRDFGRQLDALLVEPVPQRLINAILTAPMAAPVRAAEPARSAAGSSSKSRFAAWLEDLFTLPMVATFASVAAAGAGVGWTLHARQMTGSPGADLIAVMDGHATAAGALASALDTAASGAAVDTGAGGARSVIKPRLSFVSKDRSICREYGVGLPGGRQFDGIGCRSEDGRWHLEAHVPAPAAASGQVVPAGEGPPPEAIDQAIDRLIDGNVLTIAQEREVMQNGWTVK